MATAIETLIAKSLRGEATSEDEERLRAWRDASPQNEREYRELRGIYTMAPALLQAFDPGHAPSAASVIHDAEGEAPKERPGRFVTGRSKGRGLRHRGAWAAAAVLALVALGLQYLATSLKRPQMQSREFVTAAGEMRTIELSDGTVVRLSSDSRLEVVPDPGTRIVHLEGRAFFAVSYQPDRPFFVKSDAGDVRVLGTRFVLESKEGRLQLMVIEGRVALSVGAEEIEVATGREVEVIEGRAGSPTDLANVAAATDWVGAFLAFQSTPLGFAAREVERRYGVSVEITGEALRDRVVTAWFGDESLPEVVEVLCMAVVARCELDGSVVRIAPR